MEVASHSKPRVAFPAMPLDKRGDALLLGSRATTDSDEEYESPIDIIWIEGDKITPLPRMFS